MKNPLPRALDRLRRLFYDKTETAFADREAAAEDSQAEAYAEGEAHAYGDAEHAVQKAGDEERKRHVPPS